MTIIDTVMSFFKTNGVYYVGRGSSAYDGVACLEFIGISSKRRSSLCTQLQKEGCHIVNQGWVYSRER